MFKFSILLALLVGFGGMAFTLQADDVATKVVTLKIAGMT